MRGRDTPAQADDIVIARKRKQRLSKYDKYLRKFQYRKALQAALEVILSFLFLFNSFIFLFIHSFVFCSIN
jgi:hypothetical protein